MKEGELLLRLFVAIGLTEKQKDQLTALQNKLKDYMDGVRWVRPEAMHLTLNFMEAVEEERAALIQEAMDGAVEDLKPFKIQFGSCGVFPSPGKARVLWIGIEEGEAPIKELASKLESNLAAHNFKKEERIYHPHLTIGRIRGRVHQNKINKFLEQGKMFQTSATEAREVILYQSRLSNRGAVHTAVYRTAFRKI